MSTKRHDENAIPMKHHLPGPKTAGAVTGAIAGAATGAIAGPIGVAVGAAVGAAIGGMAGTVMDEEGQRISMHDHDLDRAIGVEGGDMGAMPVSIPPGTKMADTEIDPFDVPEDAEETGART